jgi:hypothetical protein
LTFLEDKTALVGLARSAQGGSNSQALPVASRTRKRRNDCIIDIIPMCVFHGSGGLLMFLVGGGRCVSRGSETTNISFVVPMIIQRGPLPVDD